MRIIAGKYKRTPLFTLEGENTRPTKDMVREALFSSIDAENAEVLDLFSGSGAVGLEALSRGAKDCVFNDSSRDAVSIIKKNLNKVGEERTVLQKDCFDCLSFLQGRSFDLVYLDPPYAFQEHDRIFESLESYGLLEEGAIVICEVRKETDLPESFGNCVLYKEKRYGITKLCYYRFYDTY